MEFIMVKHDFPQNFLPKLKRHITVNLTSALFQKQHHSFQIHFCGSPCCFTVMSLCTRLIWATAIETQSIIQLPTGSGIFSANVDCCSSVKATFLKCVLLNLS